MNIKYLCMLIILCMQNYLHDSCKFKIFITQNVSYVGNILLKANTEAVFLIAEAEYRIIHSILNQITKFNSRSEI
uniref:Uncharacterized protein n=1 Tax=Myoviridae sp. ctQQg4 TaxID=2827686 RepID=A0A8S5T9F4_9CAUD|nr:MAG TPA: hypothetical protein [Myoviridae sp. ctQQg4]